MVLVFNPKMPMSHDCKAESCPNSRQVADISFSLKTRMEAEPISGFAEGDKQPLTIIFACLMDWHRLCERGASSVAVDVHSIQCPRLIAGHRLLKPKTEGG